MPCGATRRINTVEYGAWYTSAVLAKVGPTVCRQLPQLIKQGLLLPDKKS